MEMGTGTERDGVVKGDLNESLGVYCLLKKEEHVRGVNWLGSEDFRNGQRC